MEKRKLKAPAGYWNASKEHLKEITNGCGSAQMYDFVPDAILGVPIGKACCIHDYMYYYGDTEEDRKLADTLFLYNMNVLIEQKSCCGFVATIIKKIAKVYYNAVDFAGKSSFYAENHGGYINIIEEPV